MFTRLWSSLTCDILLLGMQNDRATFQNSLTVSHKVKHKLARHFLGESGVRIVKFLDWYVLQRPDSYLEDSCQAARFLLAKKGQS